MSKHLNVHPGELLKEEFLDPMGITAYRLAQETGLPNQRIHEIIHGRRSISADTDLRLCAYFGLTPGYWLRGQLTYDLREAKHKIGSKIAKEVRPYQAAAA
jgi:antitoxin HigA-1